MQARRKHPGLEGRGEGAPSCWPAPCAPPPRLECLALPRSPKYPSPRSRNKINVFKVRVCGEDAERAPEERAEDRARSEWSLRGWREGLNGCVDTVAGEAGCGTPGLEVVGGCQGQRGGALAAASRLPSAYCGRVRASLAAAARTALRLPRRRSRGRPVFGRLLGHRHPNSSSP